MVLNSEEPLFHFNFQRLLELGIVLLKIHNSIGFDSIDAGIELSNDFLVKMLYSRNGTKA